MAALSWGLGHVTRDLPIIRYLLARGHEVTMATSGRALELLRHDAPDCRLVKLPDYPAPYSSGKTFLPKFALSLDRVLRAIARERRAARRLIERGGYDLLISDNRFNFYHPDVPCFFLSHQLKFAFPAPFEFLVPISGLYNGHYHRHFRRVIVPDYADPRRNLSGLLSHGFPVNRSRPYYAGILASVRRLDLPQDVDLFISVSGPEPQRTEFERIVRAQLHRLPPEWKVVVTLGKPGANGEPERIGNAQVHGFFGRERQQEMLNRARMVVSRSGYTTVMELAELGRKALMLPTPGQTEQEYLSRYYLEQGMFYSVKQWDLDLVRDLEIARRYPGVTWKCSTEESVRRLYDDLLRPILEK